MTPAWPSTYRAKTSAAGGQADVMDRAPVAKVVGVEDEVAGAQRRAGHLVGAEGLPLAGGGHPLPAEPRVPPRGPGEPRAVERAGAFGAPLVGLAELGAGVGDRPGGHGDRAAEARGRGAPERCGLAGWATWSTVHANVTISSVHATG